MEPLTSNGRPQDPCASSAVLEGFRDESGSWSWQSAIDNQLTIPQAVVELLGPADVYDLICEGGSVVITPISSFAASAVPSRLDEEGLREVDVVYTVRWARQA